MIILASALNIFIPLITLILVVVALLLILVVLMQRPKNEGLGAAFGGGMTDQMFGAQTTNVLQKATVWLGIIFFASTLILAILQTRQNTDKSIQDGSSAKTEKVEEGALSDQIKSVEGEGSAAPSLSEQLKEATSANDAKEAGSNVIEGAKGAVEGAGDAAGSAVESVKKAGSNVIEGAKGAVEGAGDAAGSAVESVKEAGSNLVEGVKQEAGKAKEIVSPQE